MCSHFRRNTTGNCAPSVNPQEGPHNIIDVQGEPGNQEGQGTSSRVKLQQHALELAVAGMGSLPGWLVTQGTAGEQRS